jgi:hypothetical protein
MAGSGMRGQSEEKFKALLMDTEELVLPVLLLTWGRQVICFIDEVSVLRSHIMVELH